ncbi:FkbM family methyltransferase [Variovorax sp. J22R133]|uniref:FkbM family methyltransferase n=1 Tax=Variovorax brevis TaxID=3053503 RepID=UPI002576BEC9|nr:FkbM family methyltransferase [Variovorax sp. J22R133]MDM0114690.1 FkbM family methyltransferase [Variovorax sp. J22R133]
MAVLIAANATEIRKATDAFQRLLPPPTAPTEIERSQELALLRAQANASTPRNPVVHGWSSYSQCDEDGIIRECLARISQVATLSRTFIEVGCADGLENNTHQLALDGFAGCWIDGDLRNVHFIDEALGGLQFPALMIRHSFVTLETAEQTIKDCRLFLGTEEIDLLSFDVDGNDTHLIRKALLAVHPKLIVVEYNAKFRPPTRLEMDYVAEHKWGGDDYFGASLQSWMDVLSDYTLVCCNISGVNAFFVHNDLTVPFTKYGVESLYQPARYWLTRKSGHAPSLRWLRQCAPIAKIDRPWIIEAKIPNFPPFNFEIHRHIDQFISSDLARDKIWEPFETDVFRRLCHLDDFVLDIGGNIGWYCAVASRIIGPDGRLMVFEPDPENFGLLTRNASRHTDGSPSCVELKQQAVGDIVGTINLFRSEENLGDHRLFDDGSARSSIEVRIVTLDSVLARETRLPDIVKSDTQGSEARILRGAQGLLAAGWRPIFLLEFWPFGLTRSGNEPLEMWHILSDLGYQMFEVSEENPTLTPLVAEQLKQRIVDDLSPTLGRFINILAVPHGSNRIADLRGLLD